MQPISDPQRRPVYFDRANSRFLLEPIGSGPWPVVTIEPATSVNLESLGSYPSNTWIGRIGSSGSLQAYGPDNLIDLINVASVSQIEAIRVAPGTTSGAGVVRLTDGVSSASTTTAATPNAVKSAYDLADAANTAASAAAAAASDAETAANAAVSTANVASTTANTALSTANTASLTAAGVQGVANNALTVANEAQATSSEARATANTAASSAATAAADAASATTTANSALSLANSVQTTASTAQSTATTALSTANTALSTANSAQSDASTALSTANAISATANAANATASAAQATATAAQNAVNGALFQSGGTMTGALVIGSTGSLAFEGSTENEFETTLTAVDATADNVITLPNATGTVPLLNQAQTFSGANSFINSTGQTFRQSAVADGILIRGSGSGSLGYSVEITPASLSASRTLTIPNVTGTVVTTGDTGTVTNAMLAGSIANGKLASSTISGVSLGSNLFALTLGTGLSGSSYNGSAVVTAAVAYGTTAGTACQGNDSRLSDARNTTNALTFNNGGAGSASGATFNGSAAQTISYNTIGAAASSHSHGNISSGGAIGSTANLPIITTTSGVLTTGTFGTTANTFCAGNDSRLSDARLTPSSLTFTNSGAGDASGTTFNGQTARTISFNTIGAIGASGNNAFTGANTFTNGTGQIFRSAANQDGILLRGRAGGTSGYTVELAPTTLSASRTLTLPNVSGTLVTTGDTGTVTDAMLAGSISASKITPTFGVVTVSTAGSFVCGNTASTGTGGTLRLATDGAGGTFIQAGQNTTAGSRAPLVFGSIQGSDEWARITNTGKFYVGTSANVGANTLVEFQFGGGTGEYGLGLDATSLATGTQWIEFTSGGGTNRGSVDWSGTQVRYNVTSDHRLKENVFPVVNALARLKSLKPCTFNFIEFPDSQTEGFIAHEVQEVVPGAVSGEKDAVDAAGKPVYQGLDHSKLVPLLTAALQELSERHQQTVSELTARIAALESAVAGATG